MLCAARLPYILTRRQQGLSMMSAAALRGSNGFLIFLGGLIALGPLSIDAYLPVMPGMADYFAVDIVAVNLTLSTYMLGTALGQLFGGSLSDQLGRRPVGLCGLLTFVAASLLITVAWRIEQIWALRVIQALGGGVASVICMAQLRDVYPAEAVARKVANVTLVMLVAPLLAPWIGALLLQWGWKSVFLFLALYAAVYFGLYYFFVPETHVPTRGKLNLATLFSGYLSVLQQRRDGRRLALRISLFSACSAGVFMSYLTNSAFIYMQHFGLNEFQFSGVFATGALAMMAGNRIAVKLMEAYAPIRILSLGNVLHINLLLLAAALSLLGLANFWLIAGLLLLIVCIGGAVTPSAAGFYMSLFDRDVGSAASFNATLIFLIGALFGALAALLSRGSLTPIFVVAIVAGTLARAFLPRLK